MEEGTIPLPGPMFMARAGLSGGDILAGWSGCSLNYSIRPQNWQINALEYIFMLIRLIAAQAEQNFLGTSWMIRSFENFIP